MAQGDLCLVVQEDLELVVQEDLELVVQGDPAMVVSAHLFPVAVVVALLARLASAVTVVRSLNFQHLAQAWEPLQLEWYPNQAAAVAVVSVRLGRLALVVAVLLHPGACSVVAVVSERQSAMPDCLIAP